MDCYDGAEIDKPADRVQVAIFIDNLNDQRFKLFNSKLKNDYHQNGVVFPIDLGEAFRRASDWEIDNPSSYKSTTPKTSVSYHTESKARKQKFDIDMAQVLSSVLCR